MLEDYVIIYQIKDPVSDEFKAIDVEIFKIDALNEWKSKFPNLVDTNMLRAGMKAYVSGNVLSEVNKQVEMFRKTLK